MQDGNPGSSASAAQSAAKRQRDEDDQPEVRNGKWSLDSIGELLSTMRGEMTSVHQEVNAIKRTVDVHSETLDSLQTRLTLVECKQSGFSPAPSCASSSKPPGLHRASSPYAAAAQASVRREAEEAIVVGSFREGSRKQEITTALNDIVKALDAEISQLVQECFAPGAVGEIGIIKVQPSDGATKSNMWKVYHALKALDMHQVLRAKSSQILPLEGKLRPRPSKTKEQRIKDRELTRTLIALRKAAERHGVVLADDMMRLGSAGKIYIDRSLVATVNKDTGTIQWCEDKLRMSGFPPVADVVAIREEVKASSLK